MSFNEDEWLGFGVGDFSKGESPNYFYSNDNQLDNIPSTDDPGGSPVPDLDAGYSNDLAVPMVDGYNDSMRPPSPNGNTSYTNLMQSSNNYHMQQPSTSMNIPYNSFEQPSIMNGNVLDADPFEELSKLDNATYYQQPSTSDHIIQNEQQQTIQMMDNSQYVQQSQMQNQQTTIQIQSSSSYMPQADQMIQRNQIMQQNDQNMVIQQQQPQQQQQQQMQSQNLQHIQIPQQNQQIHQQQQSQQQNIQTQQQQQQKMTPAKKAAATKAANRKKQQANSVGNMLNKGKGQDGSRLETRMTAEESMRIAQLVGEMQKLKQQSQTTGIDNSAKLAQLESEFSSIFAKNLSQTSAGNTEIVSQIKSFTGGNQQQPQPMTQMAPAPKKQNNKRKNNNPNNQIQQQQQQQQQQQKIIMDPQQAIIVTSNGQYINDESSQFGNQITYTINDQMQQQQINSKQIIMQTLPSTSQAHFVEYQQSNAQGQIVQVVQSGNNQNIIQQKVPSMNARTNVYRSQVGYQQNQVQTSQHNSVSNGQVIHVSSGQMIQTTAQQQQQTQLMQNSPQINQQQQQQFQMLNQINDGQLPENTTLGDVLRQKQARNPPTPNNSTPTLRQHLLSNTPTSTSATSKPKPNRRNNNNNNNSQMQQPQQPQQTHQSSPQVATVDQTPNVQTIMITAENSHLFPKFQIGTVIHVLNQSDAQQLTPQLQQPHMQQSQYQQPQTPQMRAINQQQNQRMSTPYDASTQPSPATIMTPKSAPTPQSAYVQNLNQKMEPIVYNDSGAPVHVSTSVMQQQTVMYEQQVVEERVIEAPPPTKEELERAYQEQKMKREVRVRQFMDDMRQRLVNPDTKTPFRNLKDVAERLLPYHLAVTPNISKEKSDEFDDNWMRFAVNLKADVTRMKERIHKLCLRDTFVNSSRTDHNLLLFLDTEYERRALVSDKSMAAENLEGFIKSSSIVNSVDLEATKSTAGRFAKPVYENSNDEALANMFLRQYEYNVFDESKQKPSPYVTPVPSPVTSAESSEVEEEEEFEDEEDSDSGVDREEQEEEEEIMNPEEINDEVALEETPESAIEDPIEKHVEDSLEKRTEKEDCTDNPTLKTVDKPTMKVKLLSPPPAVKAEEKSIEETETTIAEKPIEPEKEDDTQNSVRLPSKKEFLTRARKDVPEVTTKVDAGVSDKVELLKEANYPKASSTAETVYDSDGSGSPEIGVEKEIAKVEPVKIEDTAKLVPKVKIKPPPLPKIRAPIEKKSTIEKNDVKTEEPEPIRQPLKIKIKLNSNGLAKIAVKSEVLANSEPRVEVTPKLNTDLKNSDSLKTVEPILESASKLKNGLKLKNERKKTLEAEKTESQPKSKNALKLKSDPKKTVESRLESEPKQKNDVKLDKEPVVPPLKIVQTPMKEGKKRGRKSLEEKERLKVATPKVQSKELDDSSFRTPKNDKDVDRFVSSVEIDGKFKMKIRPVPLSMRGFITERRIRRSPARILTPSSSTRILLKLRKSGSELNVVCEDLIAKDAEKKPSESSTVPRMHKPGKRPEDKRAVPTLVKEEKTDAAKLSKKIETKIANGPKTGKAFAKMTDKSKLKCLSERKRSSSSLITESKPPKIPTTTPTLSQAKTKFTNKFNPFAFATTSEDKQKKDVTNTTKTTTSTAIKTTNSVATAKSNNSMTSSKVSNSVMTPKTTNCITTPKTTNSSTTSTPTVTNSIGGNLIVKRKISALLPWLDESPEKKKTPVKPKPPPLPKIDLADKIAAKKEEEKAKELLQKRAQSPRATSSMSLLFDDDKSNGTFPFLGSPNDTQESLPKVVFSDDEDDNDMHAEIGVATDHVIAMSSHASNPS